MLAQRFGGKWTLGLGILIITISNAATPQALEYGLLQISSSKYKLNLKNKNQRQFFIGGDYALTLIILLRILVGLGAGPSFPALAVLLAAWVPQKETGILGTLIMGGGQVGSYFFFFVCH